MIKLITPKRDLYMDDDTSNPEGLFGKKGKFYEVMEHPYYDSDVVFIDERGSEHEYGLNFLDEDFWTVDFDKGFEFKTSLKENYSFKNNYLVGTDTHYNVYMEGIAIGVIKRGGWVITRFSNQAVPTAPQEEISHPYANWKKDIGIAKFQRCIDKAGVVLQVVEGIVGYLDIKNNLFYYHKKHRGQNTYLCCKVDRDYNVSFDMEFQFIRNNKDVGLVGQEESVRVTRDFPSDEWVVDTKVESPLSSFLCQELGQGDLESYSATVKQQCAEMDKILSSFKSPEVDNSEGSPSSWEEVISEYNKEQHTKEDEHKVSEGEGNTWTDKHYDFTYKLTETDIKAGEIKIDPYFVSYQWKLGEKDNSGALWHCFKGIARFGEKNTVEREIKALHAQIKRLAEIRGVKL